MNSKFFQKTINWVFMFVLTLGLFLPASSTLALPQKEGPVAKPAQTIAITPVNPDDTEYVAGNQWALNGTWGINAPIAWGVTTTAIAPASASTVVAVLDTGFTDHADLDLTPARLLQGYDFVSGANNDGDTSDGDPRDPGDYGDCGDSSWQGTRVAGIIGAASNNTQGVAGIDWKAKIVPVRVIGDCGTATATDIMNGMRWAAGIPGTGAAFENPNPVNVIHVSASLPGVECTTTNQAYINEIINDYDVVIVAPAGDAGTTSIGFPANCDGVITVAATDFFGKRASNSNYGGSADVVEITAPGGGNGQPDVLSTSNSGRGSPDPIGGGGSIYTATQGTVMAAAHVSGVVSLMYSANPWITPEQVLKILQNTAKDFNTTLPNDAQPPCTISNCGSGIVDAGEAVRVANMPDLVITDVTVTPNGTDFDVNISVQNQGGLNLNGLNRDSIVYRGVYIDLNPADMLNPDPENGGGPGCLIQPDEPDYFFPPNFNSTIPPGVPAVTDKVTISGLADGEHTIFPYVDAECIVDESFEDNHYVPADVTPVSIYVGTPSNAPTLVSPADKSLSTVKIPKLTVQAAADALSYQFQVSADPAFGTKLVDITPAAGLTSYTLTAAQALPYGVYYWRARSNLDGIPAGDKIVNDHSDWSTPNKFAVTFQTAPISNAYLISARPTFTWAAVTGALGYKLQVSKDETFTDLKIDLILGKVTKYLPLADMDYGTYYWRLRACSTTLCDAPITPNVDFMFGSKFTLTPPLSSVPVLVSPLANAVLATKTPTLTWKKVLDDDHYQVQIDNLATFLSPERDFVTGTGIVSYTATTSPSALPDGIYYWRVRTSNYLTAPGAWSVARSFRIDTTGPLAPVLSLPASSSTVSLIGTPIFKWSASLTATKYQFQYDNDVDFLSPIYTSAELTTLSHTPPAITPGTYYWHVRAKDAYGNWGLYNSIPRTVKITLPVPLAPVLTAPVNAFATKDQTPTFSWNAVGYGNTYQIDISTVSNFSTIADTAIIPSVEGSPTYTYTPLTNLPSTLPAGQIYYWRVRAINALGAPAGAGPFSTPVRSITVDITPPLAPGLTLPADNTSAILTPTFTWAASAGATIYKFEYATNSTFTTGLYSSLDLKTTSHKPTVAMTPGTTYYWRVRAKDAAGNESAWSTPLRKVTILLAPTLTATAAAINDSTPDLSWSEVLGTGIKYEIQISKTSVFTLPVAQTASNLSALTYPVTPFLTDGLYYWRVRAASTESALPGPWSLVKSFTMDTLAPLAPVLSAPADNASVIATPLFSWLAASTAVKYKFEYDVNSGFGSPVGPSHYTSAPLTVIKFTPPVMPSGTYYWHVLAIDAAGNESVWSTPRKVTLLPAPILTATAAVISDSTPDLSWSLVLGTGITYEIQISKTATFTPPVAQTAISSGTTYPVDPFLLDGLYYWRVRALSTESALPGPWSAAKSFTVDTLAPLAPALSSPLDNASVIATPLFSWGAVVTATQYIFEYDNDADLLSPSYTSIPLTVIKITPSPAILPGTYYWHVKAKDAAGNWSAWSSSRKVTILPAPALSAPLNATLTTNSIPDFSWSAVLGTGITYEIQISKTATFTLPVAQTATGLTVLTYTPLTTLTDGLYYWRVRAAITPAVGVWSVARTFTVDTIAPAAPVLSAPLAGASVIGTPTFSWAAVSTAAKYEFEYADDSGFTTNAMTLPDLTTTKITPPAMTPDATYYWRVKAKDAAGNWGPYSTPVRSVTILSTPPAPVLTAPANAFLTNDSTPTFTWNDVGGTVTYEIQIATNSTFAPAYLVPQTLAPTGTTYTADPALINGLYYWRVLARNSALVAGAWSTPTRSFRVDTTAPVLSLPADNAPVSGTPTFSWKSTTTASRYQFEYDVAESFDTPDDITPYGVLHSKHYTSGELTTLSIKPAFTMSLGTYYWHIRAKDAAGNWTDWSAPRIVKVTPLAPIGTPILVGPINGKIIITPTPVTLSWKKVTGAVSYYIEMDNNSSFSSPEIRETHTNLNDLSIVVGPANGTYYWRVRQNDKYGGAGAWSTVWRLSVNQVIPLGATQAIE